jgi:HSP20 family molecular chaperone IbpA
MSNDIFINDFLKHAFGLHDTVNQVARLRTHNQSFPPYNIIVNDASHPTEYKLELAVAGFSKDQIAVKIRKDNGVSMLVITGTKDEDAKEQHYQVRGLSNRSFTREFTMSDAVKVDAIKLEDGILTVTLVTQEVLQKETILQIS